MRVLLIPTPPPADAPVTSGIAKYLTTLVRKAPPGVEYVFLDPVDVAFGNPYTTPESGKGGGWRLPAAGRTENAEQPITNNQHPTPNAQYLTPNTQHLTPNLRLLLGYARQAFRLARVLRCYRGRVDLIHVNFVGCEVQTVAARLAGFRRIVTTVHNLPGEDVEARRWPRRVVEWASFACGSHHVVVSEAVYAAWHQRVGLRRTHVTCIYNGMEPPVVLPRRESPAGAPVVFGICARLHPMKGHAVLLDAFDRVRRLRPDVRLRIAGEGGLKSALMADIARRGLGDHVEMLGHVDDAIAFMRTLDVHVHPSVFLEAMPYAVIEAMFAGLPQIVSDVGGAPEVIAASGGGRVIPKDDAAALADAMLHYAADRESREEAGRRAHRYAHEHLNDDQMARATASVYRKTCQSCWGGRGSR